MFVFYPGLPGIVLSTHATQRGANIKLFIEGMGFHKEMLFRLMEPKLITARPLLVKPLIQKVSGVTDTTDGMFAT